jgi:hypothetical protein
VNRDSQISQMCSKMLLFPVGRQSDGGLGGDDRVVPYSYASWNVLVLTLQVIPVSLFAHCRIELHAASFPAST